ncbi:EAL domain-containing protein [Neptuniibacter caesariensis]|uniref:cyclic-guanylate-specific phosphodiesterase n=1 Tax=Neptuniibacter caesariensis TaxID=207954 RepID=A0A7U8GTY0_NEPCE|nr:EAL domain-containing protein [Neptuniibacter caesariensis]EAR62767.1 sensory box/GGDEF/EAL/CBS domain protein [Oceanospirillum sp. MED92] [Neptuniibacter caesariensis]
MIDSPYKQKPLLVRQAAHQDLVTCRPDESMEQAVRLMATYKIGCVVICESDRPLGIVTRRDVMRLTVEGASFAEVQLNEVMTQPVKTVSITETIDDAGLRFIAEGVRHLVVVDENGALFGILSETDVVNSQGVEHDLFLRSVSEVINKDTLILPETETVRVAAERLKTTGQTAALISDGEQIKGILTENDLMVCLASNDLDKPIAEFSAGELITVESSISLYNARRTFRQHGFHHLGVKNHDEQVIGLVSYGDILRNVEMDYVYRLKELLHERDRALALSQHNLKLADKVIEASMEAIVVTDLQARIQRVNPAFTEITGYEEWEVLGKNPNLLSSGRHDALFYQKMWASLQETGTWQGEIWNKRKDGTIYPEWLTITAVEDEAGQICQYASIFSDLTEIKKSEARIKRLAYFDELTRLPNRKLFNDRLHLSLGYAQEHGHKAALAFLDLDFFQRVNDRFGLDAGDQVLREVGRRIENVLCEGDTVARFGGDSFNMILTDVEDDQAVSEYLTRLLEVVNQPIMVAGSDINLTVSIGVSFFPSDATDAEDLFQCAEAAVKQAKDFGRNSYRFFSSEQHRLVQSRYRMSGDLHRAIETDQFQLYYQPKVDLQRQTVGAEALIRWSHPELGFIPPGEFIPLAEDLGFIDQIGHYVLCEAVRQAKEWYDQGLSVQVAINVSAKQMQRRDMAEEVLQVVEQYSCPPHLLAVELTETSFLHCLDETRATIKKLRDAGISIAIDDFGTGFSSLSYIRNIDMDVLKIDRSFLINIENSDVDRTIVSSIIEMSQAMGLQVVAEGIETETQFAMLKALNCDQIQGYLIARPMPAENFSDWFKAQLKES